MHILISGSTGLIGTRIIELLGAKYTFIPLLQSEVDITNKVSVDRRLSEVEFDLLLHLAAYTNVDGAEKERELCRAINVDGTRNLLDACERKGAKMIYISTDFVFDGKLIHPPLRGVNTSSHGVSSSDIKRSDYGAGAETSDEIPTYTETSRPNPISHYGQTKYEGEELVKGKGMIVRLSYPYRKEFEGKRDFVRTVRYLLEQGKTLSMVEDSLITPTFIDDIVNGLDYLMQHYSTDIFHLVGADSISPLEAGKLIARTFGLDEGLVQPTTYAEYFKGKALRPQWARMVNTNKSLLMSTFLEGLGHLF